MGKTFYIVMLSFGAVGGLILYFQNVIFTFTLVTPMGRQASSLVILYALILGAMVGYGLFGLMNSSSNSVDDEGF